MKNIYLLLFILFCASFSLHGQVVRYTSEDNNSGNWEDDLIWSRSEYYAPINPGINNHLGYGVNTQAATVNIDGYVTRNGGLNTTHDVTVNVYDTLVVMDGLFLAGGAKFNVKENGLLIVLGDYWTEGDVDVINEGRIVVAGNFNSTGGATLNNQGDGEFYLYGTPDLVPGGDGSVGICNAYRYHAGECDIAGYFKSRSDLQNDYPPLYDFVEDGGEAPIQLPVNLLYFQARAQAQGVEINWASSKAWDFSHYELERSVDGRNFSFLASINGRENTDWTEEYSYADAKPRNGTSYYRLKAVDIDGSFEYKGIEMVQFFGAAAMDVFPNPCTTGTLKIRHAHDGAVKVRLHDNSGRTAYAGTLQSSSKSIDVSALQTGMYILMIEGTTGMQKAQVIIQ